MSLNLKSCGFRASFFYCYLCMALLLIGCNQGALQFQGPGGNKSHEVQKPINPSINEPTPVKGPLPLALLPIEDASCFSGNTSMSIAAATISSLEDGVVQSLTEPMPDVTSAGALQGDFIESTSYGMVANVTCSQEANGDVCSKSYAVTQEAGGVKICRKEGNYNPSSLEGAALTSFYHIDHLFQFYKAICPAGDATKLPKIRLLMLPTITQQFEGGSVMRQDNISYYDDMMGAPTIAVFPKGAKGQILWSKENLWQSAWVLGHESSHHIFHVLLNASTPKYGSNLLALAGTSGPGSQSASATSIYLGSIITALNESFADLFSYLSLDADSKYIEGFSCFTQTRDVGSALFVDASTKQLTAARLNTFLSPYEASESPCDINFHDPHIIGAIVAYTLNQLFHAASGVSQSASPHQEAAKLALKWVSFMPFHVTNLADPVIIMRDLLDTALRVGASSNGALSTAQCRAVMDGFPVFTDYWFGGTSPRFTCN